MLILTHVNECWLPWMPICGITIRGHDRSDLGSSEIRQGMLVKPSDYHLVAIGGTIKTQEVSNPRLLAPLPYTSAS